MPPSPTASPLLDRLSRPGARRLDLDWLRVGAFGLLILYHLGMFFGPWEWHVNARGSSAPVGAAMAAVNPWRLALLFFVSGCAARFLADRKGWRGLLRSRAERLLPPLLFGLLVLVPPQIWAERTVKDGIEIGYLRFWIDRLTHPERLCLLPGCPPVQTNHLWFLGYVLLYGLAAAALAALPRLRRAGEAVVARVLIAGGPLLAPAAYLALARLALLPRFGATNQPFSDPYGHAAYLAVFLLGFLLARRRSFWRAAERDRWMALLLALACTLLLCANALAAVGRRHPDTGALMTLAFGLDQWAAVVTLLGFASRHLRGRSGPLLDYLGPAVLPFYLLHQTLMVAAAFALRHRGLPRLAEAGIMLAVTVAGCVAAYEAGRRIPVLRRLIGVPAPRHPRKTLQRHGRRGPTPAAALATAMKHKD